MSKAMGNTYQIVDDFQVGNMRVLALDRAFDSFSPDIHSAEIDGTKYRFLLNSVRNWVSIESEGEFKGKTVIFT